MHLSARVASHPLSHRRISVTSRPRSAIFDDTKRPILDCSDHHSPVRSRVWLTEPDSVGVMGDISPPGSPRKREMLVVPLSVLFRQVELT